MSSALDYRKNIDSKSSIEKKNIISRLIKIKNIHLKSKKNIFIIHVFLILIITTSFYLIVRKYNKFDSNGFSKDSVKNIAEEKEPEITDELKEKIPDIFSTITETDPSGRFTVYLRVNKNTNNDRYKSSFIISARRHKDGVVHLIEDQSKHGIWEYNDIDKNDKYLTILYKHKYDFTGNSVNLRGTKHNNLYEWSNDAQKIALIQHGNLVIFFINYQFGKTFVLNEGQDNAYTTTFDKSLEVLDRKTIEVPINFTLNATNRITMFFSGDDKYLYLRKGNGVLYRLNLETYAITDINVDIEVGGDIYPVANSSSFAYWEYGKEATNHVITIDDGINKQKYTIPESGNVDYLGRVLFSPYNDKLCFEWGSSGYWGYALYQISNMKKLDSGQQYSYCRKWLDNNRIIVLEDLYNDQGTYWI